MHADGHHLGGWRWPRRRDRRRHACDPAARLAAHAPGQPRPTHEALPRRGHGARCPERRHRAGGRGPGRRQRGRQVHAHQDPAGAPGRQRRLGARLRPGRGHAGAGHPPARGLHAGARLPAAGHLGQRVRQPHGPHVRPAARQRPRADRGRAAPRGPLRGALPAHGRLLDGHEAARQAGPGARPRPAPAAPRRAHQRPRPGRSRRDAGAHPAHGQRVRHRHHHGQPPAR